MTFVLGGQKIRSRTDITWPLLQEEVRLRLNNRADDFAAGGGEITDDILEKMLDEAVESVIADIDVWARQTD